MARVIGIPLIKGNSNVVVSAEVVAGIDVSFEGCAVYHTGNTRNAVSFIAADGAFFGWAIDINKCASTCTVIRSTEGSYLPTNGLSVVSPGEVVKVDPATGLIAGSGSIITNARFVDGGLTEGLDGKTGEKKECAMVRVGYATDETVVAVAVASKQKGVK